jgi:hypothetical protein
VAVESLIAISTEHTARLSALEEHIEAQEVS